MSGRYPLACGTSSEASSVPVYATIYPRRERGSAVVDFELDDELELIRVTARDFAADQLRPRLRVHEKTRSVSDEVHDAFAEIGFATLELPEVMGGSGLGALARCLVLEELAAADPGAALALDPLGPALYPLLEMSQSDVFCAPGLLEAPGRRAVLVWNGAGRSANLAIEGGLLSGTVPWVPADRVDLLVVLDEEGAVAVSDGIEPSPLRGSGLRAAGASEISLAGATIQASFRDRGAAERSLARARLYNAALLVGVMRESAEFSRQYALDRVAFGKPIAHHQALAFLITDMATGVDCARMLLWDAAWRIDAGEPADEACATAYVESIEQSIFVTPNGVQILGGHGFMQDYPAEKFMREARVLGLQWGGVDGAREDAACELVRCEGPVALSAETP